MLTDKKLIEYFKECRKSAENFLKKQRKENTLNLAFYSANKAEMFKDANIPPDDIVYFNHCHSVINAVAGFMIQNRRKPECLAKVLNDEEQRLRSQYINSIADTFRENANFDHVESKQDLHMLICGYGVVDTQILYENEHGSDPEGNGEIDIERVSPNDVFFDPTSCETNLLDARYVARKKAFEKDDVERLFGVDPDDLEEEELHFGEEVDIFDEGLYRKKRDLEYVSGSSEKQVVVYQFQWWEYDTFYRVENPTALATDEEQAQLIAQMILKANELRNAEEEENYIVDINQSELILDKDRLNDLKAILENFEIAPEYVKFDKRVYYTAIISGNKILDRYKNIHQSGFTLKFKTAYRDDINGLLFGLMSLMREPAKYNAKALTEIMRSLTSTTKTGLFVERSATDNLKELEYKYKKENAVIMLNDGGINRIKEKQMPALPTGYEGIVQESKGAIRETTNITPELLGNTENKNATAALERQRIKQAITSLATFFDAVTLYQTEEMRLMIDYIRTIAENAPNKIVRIVGVDGNKQFAQLMSDMLTAEFQIQIGEAPDSAAQREETASILMDLAREFMQTGLGNIYPIAMGYINGLSEQDRQQIIEAITPKPTPPDPLEQKQKEKLIAMMDAEVNKTQAEAMDKMASVEERKSKTQKNLAETGLSEAKAKGELINSMTNVYTPFLESVRENEQPTNQPTEAL